MEPPTVLTDPADPRFDDYRNLRGAQRRGNAATNDAVIAEGRIAVERLLSSRYRVRSVLTVSSRPAAMPTLRHELPAFATTPAVLAEVCGFDFHRGVLAAADRITAATPDEVLTATRVAVLEGISDAENLGAIFRTATALGVGGLLLDERCIDPLYRRVVRVSMGWSLHVPWAWLPPLPHGLATLRASGHRVVALTPLHTAVAVDDAGHFGLLDGRVALVVGAEGPGLSEGTMEAADVQVRIPMAAGVDSLNVATALGVVAAFGAARAGWPDAPGGPAGRIT